MRKLGWWIRQQRVFKATAGVLAMLLWSGCSNLGPTTVDRDRFDYITAISESWKKQTLLNIIKMRYADAPVFLEVGQVIAGMSSKAHFPLEELLAIRPRLERSETL